MTAPKYRPRVRITGTAPAPEALSQGRGGGWTVTDGKGGRTHIDGRTMEVTHEGLCPSCGGEHGRTIRAHELSHAQFSPGGAEFAALDIDPEVVDEYDHLAEEVRIAEIMARLDIEHDRGLCRGYTAPGLMPGKPSQVDPTDPEAVRAAIVTTIRGAAACFGGSGKDWRPWSSAFTRRYPKSSTHPVREAFDDIVKVMKREVKRLPYRFDGRDVGTAFHPTSSEALGGWPWTVNLAAELRTKTEQRVERIAISHGFDPATGEVVIDPDTLGTEPTLHALREGGVIWGEMTISTPPLTVPGTRPPASARRHMPEGVIPRAMARYAVDGHIFAERRKRAGVTMLADMSGSMAWRHDDIHGVMMRQPASLLACYSGSSSVGVLTIVGAGGMVADKSIRLDAGGGNNLIDGPALAWLSAQPGPRIWLSDGQATSISGGGMTRGAIEVAREVAIAAGACRVRTLKGALHAATVGTRRRFTADDVPAAVGHGLTPLDIAAGAERPR